MTERAALYIRVSTDEQAEHGFSIPDQRRDLMARVELEGWTVVDEVVDDGYSGAVGVRPGLDKIMRLAEAGEIDVVVAKKRNRLFRDRYIRMGYERALLEYGVRLVALDDAGHRFADAVMDEFSDWFREEVRKNTIAGRMQKAREGKLVGSYAPIFGFEFTPDKTGYVVVPHRMEVVRRVIEAVAEAETINSARKLLERERVPTLRGTAVWSNTTVRRIVLNDAYRPVPYAALEPLLTPEARSRLEESGEYGIVWYPQKRITTLEPDPERGYARPRKEERYGREEQVPIPVASSGIPADLIDRARAAIRENVRFRNTGERVYELASLIRCAGCGNRMATSRKLEGGKMYHYYRCSNHQRYGSRVCPMNRSFPAAALERRVLDALLDAIKNKAELVRKAEERFEQERGAILRLGGADAASWHRTLDDLQRQRARYQRAFAVEALSLEDFQARTAELDTEKTHVERLLDEHEDRSRKLADLEAKRDKTIDLIERGEWGALGITAPEARRRRYREIGLEASVAADGTLWLSWGLGEEKVLSTPEPTSPGRSRARCRPSRLSSRSG